MTSRLSGRSILAILVGFFGVIVAVNVVFIFEAVDTFRGEDEQRPYLQGIEFNQTLQRRAEQARLGWSATLAARRDALGSVRVQVGVRDRAGRPLEHLKLVTELRHPADAARDRMIALTELGSGNYTGSIAHVDPGVWDVLVQLAAPKNVVFEAERRVWLP
jgi:nitrogen fixation protein FixH